MEISAMMMTSAAMSAVRNMPMKFVPPTISAIGRAISVKLIAAPAIAAASTVISVLPDAGDVNVSQRRCLKSCLCNARATGRAPP